MSKEGILQELRKATALVEKELSQLFYIDYIDMTAGEYIERLVSGDFSVPNSNNEHYEIVRAVMGCPECCGTVVVEIDMFQEIITAVDARHLEIRKRKCSYEKTPNLLRDHLQEILDHAAANAFEEDSKMGKIYKMKREPQYRWAHPLEWFSEKLPDAPREVLLGYLADLLSRTDGDTLQDLFQEEMDADGYFTPLGVD